MALTNEFKYRSGELDTTVWSTALPAPKVDLRKGAPTLLTVFDGHPALGLTRTVNAVNLAEVTVSDIPQVILDNLPYFGLQLELLRYVRRSTGQTNRPHAASHGGYRHPSNGDNPSGTGQRTRGGSHTYNATNRVTEWPVTGWGQSIDVSQGMAGFMSHDSSGSLQYRDPAGVRQPFNGLVPTDAWGKFRRFGRASSYDSRFRPGYFKFRWSILDVSDPREQRISGPLSETVALTSNLFPFIPDAPFGGNAALTATINPAYVDDRVRFFIGIGRKPATP